MKTVTSIIAVLLTLTLMTSLSCEKESVISEQDLPTEIKAYISTHFPLASITRSVKEKRESELYEITLSNGFKLEFNSDNKIIDVDGNSKLPDSVVPSTILTYVNLNYPGNFIMGWEIQSNNQEVQLNNNLVLINNNLVLIFNMPGGFLRIDD